MPTEASPRDAFFPIPTGTQVHFSQDGREGFGIIRGTDGHSSYAVEVINSCVTDESTAGALHSCGGEVLPDCGWYVRPENITQRYVWRYGHCYPQRYAIHQQEANQIMLDVNGVELNVGNVVQVDENAGHLVLGDNNSILGKLLLVRTINNKGECDCQAIDDHKLSWWVAGYQLVVMPSLDTGRFEVGGIAYARGKAVKMVGDSIGGEGYVRMRVESITEGMCVVVPEDITTRRTTLHQSQLITQEEYETKKRRIAQGEYMNFTDKQKTSAAAAISKNMKKANADFRAGNPSYADVAIDTDDVRLIAAIADNDEEIQKTRMTFVMAGRSTATLDLLTVKTEKNIGEESKFVMVPYLAAKRYRKDGSVWKAGYQSPFDSELPLNRFVDVNGETFQMLRSEGLFQLMSDNEIDDLASKTILTLDLYFQLFM